MAAASRWLDEEQLVVVQLGAEAYGLRIDTVREIITPQPVTRVPHTSQFVDGVLNLRGRVIPIVDLRLRLSLPPGERDRHTRIVVVEGDGGTVGLVVDAVSEVLTVRGEQVEPSSPYVGADADCIRGIAKVGERLVLLLDLGLLLRQDSLAEVTQVQ